MDSQGTKKILVIITGSIAAYKAAHVVSRLTQAGHDLKVVMTSAAKKFIGSATIEGLTGYPVIDDLYQPEHMMGHIHLIREADLVLVVPATANYINKIAAGIGDDLASTLFLAHKWDKPFLLAPAMNTAMYEHPITVESLKKLKNFGVDILDSASGILACGETGYGKLLDPDEIVKIVLQALQTKYKTRSEPSKNTSITSLPKVLVTAGGTQEYIDSARRLTNLSTGHTGASIAAHLFSLGFEVTLLLGKSSRHLQSKLPSLIQVEYFDDFQDLNQKLQQILSAQDFSSVIHTAAVSDYSVDQIHIGAQKIKTAKDFKIPSETEEISLTLKKNFKIIDQIKNYSKNKKLFLVAFKLTTLADSSYVEKAVEKLIAQAKADLVVQNDSCELENKSDQREFRIFSDTKSSNSIAVAGIENLSSELARRIYDFSS
ncbi:MAG: bifunctional phosphopantothenoylcysteine decarboxylase/phosphopantothenate--cysteine ligase CoaBC [Pseudobdellovibrionaceae bacterium]